MSKNILNSLNNVEFNSKVGINITSNLKADINFVFIFGIIGFTVICLGLLFYLWKTHSLRYRQEN